MILWLIKRKLRRRRPAPEAIPEPPTFDAREEHFASRLAFGMMKACYFSSKAADEMNRGPLAVLRNEKGEPITKVRVEPEYVSPRVSLPL